MHRATSRTVALLAITGMVLTGCSTVPASTPVAESATTSTSSTTTVPATTSSTSTTTTAPPTTTTTTRPPIDDDYVEVNGARLVYRCAGEGDVAVLVDQWLFMSVSNAAETEDFMGWQQVVDGVEDTVRICVYNRRGVGGSDNTRETAALRTTQNMVDDLAGVIQALDLDPVIMVGHSVAGFNLRLLATQRPDLVAGNVYVDASHPDQPLVFKEFPPGQPPEYLDIWGSHLITTGTGDMGDKPVYVITGLADQSADTADAWVELHADHAATSTVSEHVILEDVGHEVAGQDPQAVIDAILWVVARVQAD